LAADFVIAKDILEYRTYNKLITTYVNGLKVYADSNHFIHPLYRQAETLTGRLSSIEPNIQNMPIRNEEGQVIREIFISRFPEGEIVSADYSQIELRILAHFSEDSVMFDSFNNGIDFHSLTASRIFNVPLEKVSKEMRRTAKAINFGIIYGMSAWGLSESIHISPNEANIYIGKYFETYKKVREFLDEIVRKAKEDGYTMTILKRRRYIPEMTSSNITLRNFGERTAMNAPMQGSAADIIKIAMNRIYQRLKNEGLKSLMIAQVHDELIFDCPKEEIETIKLLAEEEMEHVMDLKVKLTAEVSSGKNWAYAK
jgi:DNA polymerase-1